MSEAPRARQFPRLPWHVIAITAILVGIDLLVALGALSWNAAGVAGNFSCSPLASGITCNGTYVLYVENDTGGWHNAHAQNVSNGTYPYGICCSTTDSATVTTTCGGNSSIFVLLHDQSNSHVQVPSVNTYTIPMCIGAASRNVTCTNTTAATCPANTKCIASIASSESSAANNTNAHIDANCTSAYAMKLCCGYSDQMPGTPTLLEPTNGNITLHNRLVRFVWTNATDPDGDATWYEMTLNSSSAQASCPSYFYNISAASFTNLTIPNTLCVRTEGGGGTAYNWSVRACSISGCSAQSSLFNFSLEPYVNINLSTHGVDFGTMNLGQSRDTSGGNPSPFVVSNIGNVVADLVNISANQSLWQSVGLGTLYFQAKANISQPGSFNTSGSLMTYYNLTTSNASIISQLNWSAANNSAAIDIRVQVPAAEAPGQKLSYLIFSWVQNP